VDHAGITFSLQGKPTHLPTLPITTRGLGWPAHRAVPASTGACCALSRALWLQLSGFDEGFINGGEDIDLCLRAGEAGRRNYIALRSVVRHHISSSIGRKLRDEPNTRRLHQRWREVIVPLIMRQSCRACLAAAWDDPRRYPDEELARDAFLFLARILPAPSERLQRAAHASLNLEMNRWAHLLDGSSIRPPQEVAWQFFPTERPEPAAL